MLLLLVFAYLPMDSALTKAAQPLRRHRISVVFRKIIERRGGMLQTRSRGSAKRVDFRSDEADSLFRSTALALNVRSFFSPVVAGA